MSRPVINQTRQLSLDSMDGAVGTGAGRTMRRRYRLQILAPEGCPIDGNRAPDDKSGCCDENQPKFHCHRDLTSRV